MLVAGDSKPTDCIEQAPTFQTVYFEGTPINLSAIARKTQLDQSLVSRIFSGSRRCSLDNAEKIADALGMDLNCFVITLKAHRNTVKETAA